MLPDKCRNRQKIISIVMIKMTKTININIDNYEFYH